MRNSPPSKEAGTREVDKKKYISNAIKVQTLVRAYLAMKKFGLKSLHPVQRTNYPAFYVGNDPDGLIIPDDVKANEAFAMIGTSCLRALDIAAKLCANQTTFIPKIYLIDNSKNVVEFWVNIKEAFSGSNSVFEVKDKIENKEEKFSSLFKKDDVFFISLINMMILIKKISSEYGFERLKKTVMNLSMVCQNWKAPIVFYKIKNICDLLNLKKIYVYASNIVSCLDPNDPETETNIRKILKNIESLGPVGSIHSNRDPKKGHPDKIAFLNGAASVEDLRKEINFHLCGHSMSLPNIQPGVIPPSVRSGANFFSSSLEKKLEKKKLKFLFLCKPGVQVTELMSGLVGEKETLYSVGISQYTKKIIMDYLEVECQLWCIPMSAFEIKSSLKRKGYQGLFCVYDINDKSSFEFLEKNLRGVSGEDCQFYLLGDAQGAFFVNSDAVEAGEKLAKTLNNAPFREIDSRTGRNINGVLEEMLKKILGNSTPVCENQISCSSYST